MQKDIYKDIAMRTDGDIYIGVVGPVRTGKSTFIKKFMETLVIPNIDNSFKKDRALDELPQSAAGRTIMTTEPKFIPDEAVEISLNDNVSLKVRVIDCVGYIVPSLSLIHILYRKLHSFMEKKKISIINIKKHESPFVPQYRGCITEDKENL